MNTKTTERTEFGFERVRCSCDACAKPCQSVSGMLVPMDVLRIASALGYSLTEAGLLAFAREHLQASPGALVLAQGQVKRVKTLVPRRTETGACHWLDAAGKCSIYDVAPYGCAFFDLHMSYEEGMARSVAGLEDVLNAILRGGPYLELWQQLEAEGKKAAAPEIARREKQ